MLSTVANAINTSFYQNLSFDFARDIAAVGNLFRVPLVMEINPSLPVKTVAEFIAYAKANPGKITLASAGTGTSGHISAELFAMMAGIKMVHVPYRGAGPALVDVIGGQCQVIFDLLPSSIGYVRAGSTRALAVTTTARSEALPDVPVLADFVPGYEASAWIGIGAPRDTPAEIVDRLNQTINAGLADPGMKARFAELGGTAAPGTPAEFGAVHRERNRKVEPGDQVREHQGRLIFARGDPCLHRLIAALHVDIDQHRLAVLERLADQIGGVFHGRGALGFDAERAGQSDEIDRRVVELHADEFVGLLGKPAQHHQALLQDAIAGVVEDHPDDRQPVTRRGPESLDRVHCAAVADQRHHRPVGQRQLGADRGRQSPADAAAAQAEETLRVVAVDQRAYARRRR